LIELPPKHEIAVLTMLDWVPNNGFHGRLEQTHSGVVALKLADSLIPEVRQPITNFVLSCRQPDGGLQSGEWPESDMEGAYSGVRTLKLLGTLDHYVDSDKLVNWIRSRQNPDGGFGYIADWYIPETYTPEQREGVWAMTSQLGRKEAFARTHPFRHDSSAHSCYFCYGALEALGEIDAIDTDRMVDFLVSSQRNDGSWGFYPDNPCGSNMTTCFALHVLSKLDALDRIDGEKTIRWLLSGQWTEGPYKGGWTLCPGEQKAAYGVLYTARASKAMRILGAFDRINRENFEDFWKKHPPTIGGWSIVCLSMARGDSFALQER
jgi:prenyltransferase beta subunit